MEPPSLLAELTRLLARTAPRAPISLRLCQAFTEILAVDGAAITVGVASPGRIVLCATDDPAAGVEDAQDILSEGPSLDASRTGLAVSGLTLVEQRVRWPLLAELLDTRGLHLSLHAFPVRPESAVLGVVCAYQNAERALAVSPDDAQFLANALGVALLGDLESHTLSDERWAVRDRVDQATGMVMAQLKVRPEDAAAVLRAHAFAHSATMETVSGWVLDRVLDFSDSGSSDTDDSDTGSTFTDNSETDSIDSNGIDGTQP
jgi:hypothetical protein